MKRTEVDAFEKLVGQLTSVYEELSILSKKAPNDAVNPFKLRFVNSLSAQANELLGGDYRPFDEFTEFDGDDVPQNSDVIFILSQYLQCFEKLRADNVEKLIGVWYWVLDEEPKTVSEREFSKNRIQTVRPRRLKE